MKYLRQFLLMVQFLTRIPVTARLDVDEKDFGEGLAFAPLVGFIIGLILYAIYMGASFFLPLPAVSVVIVVSYILLSGGLHFDGLGDTFDGVFSGRPKQRVMEIMKDSRCGTNALLAIICVVLMDIAFIYTLLTNGAPEIIVLFPVTGRLACLVGAGAFNYARDDGLGKSFVNHCGAKHIAAGLITLMVVHFIFGGFGYIFLGAAGAIAGYLLNLFFSKKISGVTGDILGACCELNQMFYLMFAVFILKF